jgi:mRNA interferase MazF
MAIFNIFDVVAAPFPYIERPVTKRRPCIVIAEPEETELAWVIMITSAKNKGWVGDVEIQNLSITGLKVPSLIRTAKIATVESNMLKCIGKLDLGTITALEGQLKRHWKIK